MLSLQQCKDILCKNGNKYSENEIQEFRSILFKLAEINYETFKAKGSSAEPKTNNLLLCGSDISSRRAKIHT